eukprot:1136908-Pelagomonas_calceolata.AAC.6
MQQESLRQSGETTPQPPPSDSPPSCEEEAQQQLLEQPSPAQVQGPFGTNRWNGSEKVSMAPAQG